MYHRGARHREALGHAQHALALYRSTHHRAGQAGALNDVGWCLTELGEHEEALVHCDQALRLHRELDTATARPRRGTASATPTTTSDTTPRR
ncbi:tetratricopeptide repeat protein [Actinosynnema sp. CS-041913]|uniref:tetratricopeptide repeat protein n=1 Tax=Actinosynnema sp. CS-041913 TaxID=3239917 RepID=UPI003D8A7717